MGHRGDEVPAGVDRLLELGEQLLLELALVQVAQRDADERRERAGELDLLRAVVAGIGPCCEQPQGHPALARQRHQEPTTVRGWSDLRVKRHRVVLRERPELVGLLPQHGDGHELPVPLQQQRAGTSPQQPLRPLDDLVEQLAAVLGRAHQQREPLQLAGTLPQVVVAPRTEHDVGQVVEVAAVLGHVVDGARSHGVDGDVGRPCTGHHDDRRWARHVLDLVEHVEAGVTGQAVVQQHQVHALDLGHGLGGVGGDADVQARTLQGPPHQGLVVEAVLDHQHTHRPAGPDLGPVHRRERCRRHQVGGSGSTATSVQKSFTVCSHSRMREKLVGLTM